ncbi:MAG: hypothetical protein GX881_05635 [Firmicutes bacterium]|nr:hypothetical protein [Bacillota bacterium]
MARRRRRTAASSDHLRVLPGKGRRLARFRQAATFYIILGLLAVLVLQAAYHWLSPYILARRLQIEAVTVGTLEDKIEVAGLVTRQELLLTAPGSGVIVELAPPGERLPAGEAAAVIAPLTGEERQRLVKEAGPAESFWERTKGQLLKIFGGDGAVKAGETLRMTGPLPPWITERVPLKAPEAGLLLHRLDGWEEPGERAFFTEEEYNSAERDPFEAKVGLWVEKGQPLVKLVDNWEWRYNLLLPLDPGRTLAAREQVLFRFDFAPENPVSAGLVAAEIDPEKEEVRLTYRIRKQFPGFEERRWLEAALVLESSEGMVIPAAAVVEHKGKPGVYLNLGGAVKFRAIKILAGLGDDLVVEGIEPDSMVIMRPGLVEEGQRLN